MKPEEFPKGTTTSSVLTFTLLDGREVSGDSEEWRFECEAREVLKWSLARRKRYLYGYTDEKGKFHRGVSGRGPEVLRALEELMRLLWVDKQARLCLAMDELTRNARLQHLQSENGFNMRDQIEKRMHVVQQQSNSLEEIPCPALA